MIQKKYLQAFIFLSVTALLFSFGLKTLSAGQIFCPAPDSSKLCGMTQAYNMSGSCALSGPDLWGGNRILGGQKCSIGGTDDAGYYMIGTAEPTGSTPTYPYGAGTAPGWTYSKSGNLFTSGSIPSGEWYNDSYYLYRYFGSSVSISQPQADDESMLQIGSNYSYWTGCNHNGFRSVFDPSCPAATFMGNTSINASPGNALIFSVQNDLRPNNGSGTWGSGNVSVVLNQVTMCYTSAYKTAVGGYVDTQTFHPTADGVCTPETPTCDITSLTASSINPPYNTSVILYFTTSGSSPNWVITPGGATGSGSGSWTTPPLTTATTYTVACSANPSKYKNITITPISPPVASITASPNPVTAGQPVTLNWGCSGTITDWNVKAGATVIYSGGSTVSPSSGTQYPLSPTTYTMTCNGPGGTNSASVTVNISIPSQPSGTISSTASCTAPCNVAVSWTSQYVANPPNLVKIYKNGAFLWNQTANTPGSETDWSVPTGSYPYCLKAVNADYSETQLLPCSNTTVTSVGCTYSISPTSASYGSSGGSGSFSVITTAGCAWTASPAYSWITITSGSPGSGSGTVYYSVASNAGAARTGTITAGGQTFTISQSGTTGGAPTCNLTASPSSGTAPLYGTLSWSTLNNPTLCSASGGPWSGSKSVSGSSEAYGPLSVSTVFSLTCSNAFGSNSCSAPVTVGSAAKYRCFGATCIRDDVSGIYSDPYCSYSCVVTPKYKCNGTSCIRDDITGIFTDSNCLGSCIYPISVQLYGSRNTTYSSLETSFPNETVPTTIYPSWLMNSISPGSNYEFRVYCNEPNTTTDPSQITSPVLTSGMAYGQYSGWIYKPYVACTYSTPGNYFMKIITGIPNMSGTRYQSQVPIFAPIPQSHITLSSTSFTFNGVSGGATPAGQTLTIGNTGSTTLNWTGSVDKTWCHLSSGSGSVIVGGTQPVTVSVDSPSSVGVGTFNCTVTVSDSGANNSPQTASVTYNVTPAPVYSYTISSTSLSFSATQNGSLPASQNITVTNTGNQSLTITVSEAITWAGISKTSITLPAASSTTVAVSISTTALSPQVYTGTINFTNAQGAGNKTTNVNYTVNSAADFTLNSSNGIHATLLTGGPAATSDNTTITVIPSNGFSISVNLSVQSINPALAGATYNFSNPTLTSSQYSTGSTFSVTVPSNTPAGTYTIIIQGRDGGLIRTVTPDLRLNVEVFNPGWQEI